MVDCCVVRHWNINDDYFQTRRPGGLGICWGIGSPQPKSHMKGPQSATVIGDIVFLLWFFLCEMSPLFVAESSVTGYSSVRVR
jgi:hypothetical protein